MLVQSLGLCWNSESCLLLRRAEIEPEPPTCACREWKRRQPPVCGWRLRRQAFRDTQACSNHIWRHRPVSTRSSGRAATPSWKAAGCTPWVYIRRTSGCPAWVPWTLNFSTCIPAANTACCRKCISNRLRTRWRLHRVRRRTMQNSGPWLRFPDIKRETWLSCNRSSQCGTFTG